MLDRRNLIAITATIIADSVWLYPALAFFSLLFLHGAWPLPLALILAVIALGVVVGRTGSSIVEDPANRATFQALFGLGAIYLAISAIADEGGIDLLWGPRLIGGGFSGNAGLGLAAATVTVGFLWRRGVRIAVETHPRLRLLQSFRGGIVALAASILLEQALDVDFSATVMLIPFFAVSLAGLAFARLPSGSAWSGIAGLTVTAVIGGGLVVGLIGAAIGGRGLEILAVGWRHLLSAVGWLLTVLLTPVLEAIFAFLSWLIGDAAPRGRARPPAPPSDFEYLEGLDLITPPPFVELVIQLIKYPLLLLAIYLLYRLLRWAYQAHALRIRAVAAVDRESIQGKANAKADLIRLVLGLLPGWLTPVASPADLHYPRDKPGISEAYILYFEMLAAARDRDYDFATSATTRERRPDIENALPGAPVERITECFNAACYGNIATDRETLEQLRRAFEGAVGAE